MLAPCFTRGQLEELAKLLGEEVNLTTSTLFRKTGHMAIFSE